MQKMKYTYVAVLYFWKGDNRTFKKHAKITGNGSTNDSRD